MARPDAAGKTAGIQDVTYQTDQQTLILNTATAYFKVLAAIDTLSYTEAQKQAIYRQLDQTTQRFNVGPVAITDVQNARSQYDAVLANEVTARNDLDNAVEELRQVTGNYYPELASLNVNGFKTNKPQAVNALLKEAENRNLSLLQARLNEDGSRADSPRRRTAICRRSAYPRRVGYRILATVVQKPIIILSNTR